MAQALELDPDDDDHTLLKAIVCYYRKCLLENNRAQTYLDKRRIGALDAVETFGIGYADRQLGLSLPPAASRQGKRIRKRLQEIGILRLTGHGHFNGCVVFPVLGDRDHVTEIYGRKIGQRLRKGTALRLYLHPDEVDRGVWNIGGLKGKDEAILCHSIIEALTFWCAGYRNVIAVFGIWGFTDEHVGALQETGISRVFIAYGNTEAADAAIAQVAERLNGAGIETARVEYPRGKDANDVARREDSPRKALGDLLSAAAGSQACTERHNLKLQEARMAFHVPQAPLIKTLICKEDAVVFEIADRRYRVRGLEQNMSLMALKVNVLATRDGKVHCDTLDFAKSRSRSSFVRALASELCLDEPVLKKDVGALLLKLEELQSRRIEAATATSQSVPEMPAGEREEALGLLRDPNLLTRIVSDLDRCGVVGERTNKLAAYLAAVSRKLAEPLAVLIQSSSSAGKTRLMNAILAMMPPEEQLRYTGMTGQSLFYLEHNSLKHKILAISEDKGAIHAAYALKLLQSEGELRQACVGKLANGRMGTQEYHVEGPVQVFLTTTASDTDDELVNRCLVLTIDESRDQTRAIHDAQRLAETREGKRSARAAEEIRRLHQNAQRLLRPLQVDNSFATQLTFPDNKTRMRRDHRKYLALINAVALLHQYQRPINVDKADGNEIECIAVTSRDIAIANGIAAEVLGRTLDELSPQTRRLLLLLHEFVGHRCREAGTSGSEIRFTRREVRETLGWSDFQVRAHLARLVAMEYVLVHSGRRGRQLEYELLYDGRGREGQPFLMGLLDPAELDTTAVQRSNSSIEATTSSIQHRGLSPH